MKTVRVAQLHFKEHIWSHVRYIWIPGASSLGAVESAELPSPGATETTVLGSHSEGEGLGALPSKPVSVPLRGSKPHYGTEDAAPGCMVGPLQRSKRACW
ncbi:unnamed protein product [Boreogadus saida]